MTTKQHRRGGKSLLDLPGELRNAIYEHFIDLNTCACDTNAINLLWVNRQIRAEFRSLYFSQGNAKVYLDGIASFLRAFIQIPSTTLMLDDVACKIRVELRGRQIDYKNWQIDLVDVILVMRQYPLLSIKWNLIPPGHSETHSDLGLAEYVSILKDMDDHEFAKLSSIWLLIHDGPLGGDIYTFLERGCTEQDTDDIQLKIGGINRAPRRTRYLGE
ncbi:hypothetical protein J4E85_009993 [Alternaria conjuncta]|uniref:uncharacterized protein n=1 Tax=Alternaria conjuncta TaxID=181017 RepID=UPI002220763B|nr:uncharacterized protein J4E85_009993 [Alternaria conjuncta]KAI4917474.1 hypothetical protein J4E85_009993 [Alternaria conjuncta]